MTAYLGTKAQTGIQPRTLHTGQIINVNGSFALTGALANNDTIALATVPAGATMLGVTVATPVLDSDGSPTMTFNVGDAGGSGRFILASTMGQTGGFQEMNVATGVGYAYTSRTSVLLTVTADPATAATTGTINYSLRYTMDP